MALNPANREGLPAADAKFLEIIEHFGWHVMTVALRAGEDGNVWAYSTGLYYTYQHPEILLFNLGNDTLIQIINQIGRRVRAGEKFEPGPQCPETFANCECAFRPVPSVHHREHVGFSIWFYEHAPFPLLQCFWPDKSHRFLWEPECDEEVRDKQPLLYRKHKTSSVQ